MRQRTRSADRKRQTSDGAVCHWRIGRCPGKPDIATYGDGQLVSAPALQIPPSTHATAPLPSEPRIAAVAEIAELADKAKATPTSETSYIGPDWATQGDWMGRYGRLYAVLCAGNSPLNHVVSRGQPVTVVESIGPHASRNDALRNWIHSLSTDNVSALWNPYVGRRRQADWDDHGENYALEHEGPDLWIRVKLPEGTHQVSLYFYNKDGRSGTNRLRDYDLQVKRVTNLDNPDAMIDVARARIRDFVGGGVYHRFALTGEGDYAIKIGRNGSFNTICNGVMIDRMSEPATPQDAMPRPLMGGMLYSRPDVTSASEQPRGNLDISRLNTIFNNSVGVSTSNNRQVRIYAYRVATAEDVPADILANWRWTLPLWTALDREEFQRVTQDGWKTYLANNPKLKSKIESGLIK